MRMPFTLKLYKVGLALMAAGAAGIAALILARCEAAGSGSNFLWERTYETSALGPLMSYLPTTFGVTLLFLSMLAVIVGSGRTFSGSYWNHQRLG